MLLPSLLYLTPEKPITVEIVEMETSAGPSEPASAADFPNSTVQ